MSMFQFKNFSVEQIDEVFKIGTDAMVLGAFIDVENSENIKNCLDIGTGTGVLGLFLATKFPEAAIFAIDINSKACELANKNFSKFQTEKNTLKGEIEVIEVDLKLFNPVLRFDLIVSNPPFFANSSKNEQKELILARHQDSLLLENLLINTKRLLAEDGIFIFIFPEDQTLFVREIAVMNSLFEIRSVLVFGKPNMSFRRIFYFSKNIKYQGFNSQEENFIIRDNTGNYTKQYISNCGKFHDREV